jgi:tetratricopeptide (TPR) repeat protein/predicted Ser/Thr protein kinase
MIGKTISHYKILEKIGEGGMGVVYKAQDIQLQRPVALKFLPPHIAEHPEEKARFIHEAQSASALNHTNVTTIYGIEESPEGMFIAMEYVEGRTLKQIIEEETLSIKKILAIGIQICEGMAMAHEKGVVHRDIKSDNIMVTPRGQVKIMDFGLAKLKGSTKITQTGSTLGTASYMSPEQAQGEEVDQRSDIFSFGVVLYELLTGHLPFKGEHQAAIIFSVVNEEPQSIARYNNKVSSELERIVNKALVKDRDERYQHIDDLLADLRRERKSLEYVKTTQIPVAESPQSKRKLLPFIIPASVVFILALIFLILRPFKLEVTSEKGAVAKENSLAVMYFENMADPEDKDRIAQMITALLITGLSDTPRYMEVVSSQRLYDILKLLGKENLKVIDKTVASEVARQAQVRWILTGEVLQTKPNIVLLSEISDATSGKILATQRVSGAAAEDLFAVVDKLSQQVAKALSLPEKAEKEIQRPIAEVTTHSQQAYSYYLEGVDYNNKYYSAEAEQSFKKALDFDSTFAMAYYWLAGLKSGDERKRLTAQAVKYSDKASQKEKYYIQSWAAYVSGNYTESINELQKIVERYPEEKQALFYLGFIHDGLREFDKEVYYLNKAIQIDPLYKDPYNWLAYAYDKIGDPDKSIWAINKYIELAPDEPNPYDTRGDLYAWNGKLAQAIESYQKASAIKPDFSLTHLGHMYLLKREYAKAESCYLKLTSSSQKDTRSWGRVYLALIPIYQGKFDQALKVLDDGIAADRMEQVEGRANLFKHGEKAIIFEQKGNLELALNEINVFIEDLKKISYSSLYNWTSYRAKLLSQCGRVTEAEELARWLKKDIETKDSSYMYCYWVTMGYIEQAKGNAKSAVSFYEKADKEGPPAIYVRVQIAEQYLQLGRLGETVAVLERALTRYDDDRACFPTASVEAYYLLGLAYEKSGWYQKAIDQYEEFLDIWKNADPGIPEVKDAEERVKRLQTGS